MNTATQNHDQPLLNPTPPADQAEMVKAIFAKIEEDIGMVPDGLRLYGMSPPLLQAFLGYVGYFRSENSGIPAPLATMIRYLVSSDSNCPFCIGFNETFLLQMGFELDALHKARENPDKAPVSAKEQTLIDLALKAVDYPENVAKEDLDRARKAGWTERDLFDCVVLASNNRAFNLVLKTFKVHHQGAFH